LLDRSFFEISYLLTSVLRHLICNFRPKEDEIRSIILFAFLSYTLHEQTNLNSVNYFEAYYPHVQLIAHNYTPKLHTHNYTPTTTHPQLHNYKYTPTTTHLQLHTYNYTPTTTHLQLHTYNSHLLTQTHQYTHTHTLILLLCFFHFSEKHLILLLLTLFASLFLRHKHTHI
jgi:hypothetical protein